LNGEVIPTQALGVRVDSGSSGVESIRRLPSRTHQVNRLTAKSVVDVAMAFALVLVLSPILLLIAVVIKSTSRGPVFFVQDRIGRGEVLFPMLKFRTMRDGAHLERDDVLGTPDEEMLDRYKNDPRITRVGGFLRRWSMDELPQLINVAVGHMAIVGPRPILEAEEGLLEEPHHDRHLAKPGLTGLWQISGRKETTWEKRMELDLEYVRTMSVRADVVIMARTAGVIIKGDGSY
jgi:lipopolysaccharide/colanic/teichoic acid biosynthesis glycosyltransferase